MTFESREPWWSLRKTVRRESNCGWARRNRGPWGGKWGCPVGGREVGVSGSGEAGQVGEYHHIVQKYTFPQGIPTEKDRWSLLSVFYPG